MDMIGFSLIETKNFTRLKRFLRRAIDKCIGWFYTKTT